MSLIVEDGTSKVDAESYASVADADSYHEKRANAAWDTVLDKEAALRKATDYMLQAYRTSWKGIRLKSDQALCWPRSNVWKDNLTVVATNIVPQEVKNACCELALRAATDDLNPDLDQQVLSESVGPISTTYDPHSPQQKRFRAVGMTLRVLMRGNTLSMKVGRS